MQFDTLMSQALRQYTTAPGVLEVEREDGHISRVDIHRWMDWSLPNDPIDDHLLAQVQGPRVLDVGCSTGRHVKQLQGRGLEVRGIDVCQGAIEEARRRELTGCECADLWSYKEGVFDDILLLGGNLGIAGVDMEVGRLLRHLESLGTPRTRILLSSVDYQHGSGEVHTRYQDQLRARGEYPGNVRMRLRWNGQVSDWFRWVWVDAERLSREAAAAGWRCDIVLRQGARYGAILGRQSA
jgi:SAM-dependent methyltransferase